MLLSWLELQTIWPCCISEYIITHNEAIRTTHSYHYGPITGSYVIKELMHWGCYVTAWTYSQYFLLLNFQFCEMSRCGFDTKEDDGGDDWWSVMWKDQSQSPSVYACLNVCCFWRSFCLYLCLSSLILLLSIRSSGIPFWALCQLLYY